MKPAGTIDDSLSEPLKDNVDEFIYENLPV